MECDVLGYCIVNFLSPPTTDSHSRLFHFSLHKPHCPAKQDASPSFSRCALKFTAPGLLLKSLSLFQVPFPSLISVHQLKAQIKCTFCEAVFVYSSLFIVNRCLQTLCKGTDSKIRLCRPHIVYLIFVLSKCENYLQLMDLDKNKSQDEFGSWALVRQSLNSYTILCYTCHLPHLALCGNYWYMSIFSIELKILDSRNHILYTLQHLSNI